MHIRQLTAHIVRLPLKRPFVHATAARTESENVIVRCELADGTTGWGEGVPRRYVTGETAAGAVAQLAGTPLAEQLDANCAGWPHVLALCERFAPTGGWGLGSAEPSVALAGGSLALDLSHPPDEFAQRGCLGNALRCAVELSVLDAFGRLLGEPVSAAAAHYEPARSILAKTPSDQVQYSAVIDSGHRHLWRKALVRRLYGFRHCKVKVGAEGDDDPARLRTIRRWLGPRVDLRLDANGAWHAHELCNTIERLAPFNISCIEQPLPHAEVTALAELRSHLSVPIMLDESLTSEADARAAIDARTCDLFNIRLSKCGGFLASLRMAALARAAGVGYQLGCHPGESGILSAAGRHWACAVAGIRYLEGSYDRYLFRRLLTNEDLTFGFGGRAPALAGPGLGVTIRPDVLSAITIDQRTFPIA